VHLSEKQLLILTVVTVVVIVIGGAAWGYYRYNTYQELQVEIKKLEEQVVERSRKAKTIEDLKTLFQSETFKKEEEALAVRLPVESTTGDTDFWMQVNKMRKTTHPQLVLRRVEGILDRPGVPEAGQGVPPEVRRMTYKIELRGNFYDILEYMSELENSDRIVRVDNFQFRSRRGSGGPEGLREAVTVEASIRILAYEYKKAPAAPGTPPAP